MHNWSQKELNELYEKIMERSKTDMQFRAKVLNDTQNAVKEITEHEIPDDFKVRFVENKPGYAATYVLPDAEKEELSDSDLDKVAGGDCYGINFGDIDFCAKKD